LELAPQGQNRLADPEHLCYLSPCLLSKADLGTRMNGDHLPPDLAGLEQGRKTEAGAPPPRKERMKRGGQKGNQNARKHGFYSGALDPAEIGEFWNIINLEGLPPEIALLRIKLRSSLQQDPGNPHVLSAASKLLVRLYSSRSRLSKTNRSFLKRLIRAILMRYSGASPGRPGSKDN
ncbi:MAG: hypothetical protein Q8P00_01740, partial [Dehalococcoidia bacterium]|nr:hypothetical protein [Dehalococcoidia bacterium]